MVDTKLSDSEGLVKKDLTVGDPKDPNGLEVPISESIKKMREAVDNYPFNKEAIKLLDQIADKIVANKGKYTMSSVVFEFRDHPEFSSIVEEELEPENSRYPRT